MLIKKGHCDGWCKMSVKNIADLYKRGMCNCKFDYGLFNDHNYDANTDRFIPNSESIDINDIEHSEYFDKLVKRIDKINDPLNIKFGGDYKVDNFNITFTYDNEDTSDILNFQNYYGDLSVKFNNVEVPCLTLKEQSFIIQKLNDKVEEIKLLHCKKVLNSL